MADEFVRIRNENGMESTISASYAAGIEVEILDEPATNTWGRPMPATRRNGRPAKTRTTVKKAAAKKAASKKAEASTAPVDNPPTTGGPAADSPEEASR